MNDPQPVHQSLQNQFSSDEICPTEVLEHRDLEAERQFYREVQYQLLKLMRPRLREQAHLVNENRL